MNKIIFNMLSFGCLLCTTMSMQNKFENYMRTRDGHVITQTSFSTFQRREKGNNILLDEVVKRISLEEENVHCAQYVIYGNTTDLKASEFRKIMYEGNDKIYLHYRTNHKIALPYDALLVFKENGKLTSYEFKENDFTSEEDLKSSIIGFIKDSFRKHDELLVIEDEPCLLSNDDIPQTFVNCNVSKNFQSNYGKHGYINFQLGVERYRIDNISSLYIVYADIDFVPGRVARQNGNTKEFSDCICDKGYFHLEGLQAYDKTEEQIYGTRYGAIVYPKDYWPVNNPSIVTIGSSISDTTTIGYSFENGFSLDNISVSEGSTYGRSISKSYSKSITIQDPLLTAQRYLDQAQWSFVYKERITQELTYHLSTGYMFESRNDGGAMSAGDFRLKIETKMNFKCKNIFGDFILKNSKTLSYDLMVRSTVNQDIYDFNDGMF